MSNLMWIQLASCDADSVEYALARLLRLTGLSELMKPPPKGLGVTVVQVTAWASAKAVPVEHHQAIRDKLAQHELSEGYGDGGENNGQWSAYVADYDNGNGLSISAIARKYDVSRTAVQKALTAAGVR